MGTNFPVAGGGYLRIFPSAYTDLAFRIFEKKYHERVVVYLHPWELDPEQPRIAGPLKSRLRHYTNLQGMRANVSAVLQRHRFVPFRDVMATEDAAKGNLVAGLPVERSLAAVAVEQNAFAGTRGKGNS
jgi:hypothetical protein